MTMSATGLDICAFFKDAPHQRRACSKSRVPTPGEHISADYTTLFEELPREIRMLWPEPQVFFGLNAHTGRGAQFPRTNATADARRRRDLPVHGDA